MTDFCKISVRNQSKHGLEFSIGLGLLKISRIDTRSIHVQFNFRSLSNKFPTIFGSLFFHISLPMLGYFS